MIRKGRTPRRPVSGPRLLTATLACALIALTIVPFVSARTRLDVGFSDDALRLVETGVGRKNFAARVTPEIKIVSYNIRWRSGENLKKLIQLLRTDPEIGGASIIGLQEVDRDKERTHHENTVKILAENLGLHYVWAAPPQPRPREGTKPGKTPEEETGVAILSEYALTNVDRLVLEHEGPNRRRRVALGATAKIGDLDVRVYCVHSETRMPLEKKLDQWRAVLENLSRYPALRHVIIVGDFNTIDEKDVKATRKMFTEAGFETPFPDREATFKVLFFDFKLDWIWTKGFKATAYGIDRKIGLSDHWPIWTTATIARTPASKSVEMR